MVPSSVPISIALFQETLAVPGISQDSLTSKHHHSGRVFRNARVKPTVPGSSAGGGGGGGGRSEVVPGYSWKHQFYSSILGYSATGVLGGEVVSG